MRRKRKGIIRYKDAAADEDLVDLIESGSEEGDDNSTHCQGGDNSTHCQNEPPLLQNSYHVIEKNDGIERVSVCNGSESEVSCSGRLKDRNTDHSVETGLVKLDAEISENDLEPDSEIIKTGDSEDHLSSVVDNPWYSVKARRGEDGLKEFVFVCKICDKLCNRRANMEDHIRSHAGIKPFSCKYCHVKLSRKQNLKSHFTKMHKFSDEKVKSLLEEVDSPDPAVNCRELRQYVRDNEKYDRQVNQNNKRTLSDESTTDYTNQKRKTDFEEYQNTAVTNDAEYNNEERTQLSNNEDLTLTDEDSRLLEDYGEFTCIEVIHDGTPTKQYQCKTCRYRCTRRYTMKEHTLTHTGVKRYYCEICDAEYTKNTFLKVHLAKDHSISHPELDEMVKRASENAVSGIWSNIGKHEKHEKNVSRNVTLDIDPCEPNVNEMKTEYIGEIDNEGADVFNPFLKAEKYEDEGENSDNGIDDKMVNIRKDKEIGEKVEDYGNFTCIEVTDKFSQSKVYRCKVCSYECTRRYTMKTHAWTHSGYKRFCCILCGNSFTRSTYFRFHLRKAHSVIGAEMDKIVKEARKQDLANLNPSQIQTVLSSDDENSKYLSGDSREASPLKENLCQLQQNTAVTNTATEESSKYRFKAKFEENECGDLDRNYHFKAQHRDNELFNTTVNTNILDDSPFCLSEHSSKESSVEKELFVNDDSIKDAIETLMDCEMLQCLKCLKMFSTKTNLKSHVKTHFNIKPYSCPICQKLFGKNRNMKNHAEKMHSFLGPFPEADALALHLKGNFSVSLIPSEEEHTKAQVETRTESPFQTQFSSKEDGYHANYDDMIVNEKETEKHALLYDESEFMDVENLRCKKCYKTYTSKGNLKAHVKLHFNLRPYACPVCKQKFNNSSNMKVHAKKMHNFTTFSTDSSSDVAVKEVIDAFKSKYPQTKATDLGDRQKKDIIDLSENPKIEKTCLDTNNTLGDKMNVNLDSLKDTSSVVLNDKQETEVTGISFETMAEELWGYNDSIPPDTTKESTKESLEIKKGIEENENELKGSVQNTVNSPYKSMKQETLDKTDYNSMMTDLMKMAGSGIPKHPMSKALHESFRMNTGFTPQLNINNPDNFTHLMGKWEQGNILNTIKRKTDSGLSAFNGTDLTGGYGNTRKNGHKAELELSMKFNPPGIPQTLITEQYPANIFPGVRTSPYADPNIVKLKTLMDEDNLQCRDCLKRFANKWSLKAHVKAIHLKGKRFTCSVCYKTFNFKCNVERHYIVHNPNWTKEAAPFEPFLHSGEDDDSNTENGERGKESGELGTTDVGAEDSRSKESFSDAESSDKLLANVESPKKHVTDIGSPGKHSENIESPSKHSSDDDAYNAEVETLMDLDYFQCKKCLKQFANKWSLKAHVKSIHVQSRKYCCPVCQKSFNHKCNLDRHYVIHPEYDPKKEAELNESSEFQCSFCKKSFANKWSMKAHVNAIHVNSRQYACSLCRKMFNHKCNLERHILKHVGEGSLSGNFESETDEMPLDLSSDSGKDDDWMNKTGEESEVIEIPAEVQREDTDFLSFDERILMDMDKMKCIKCGKRFGDKSELKEHVRGHIDRNLTCGLCKRSFSSTDKLKRHYNVHLTDSGVGTGEKGEWLPNDDNPGGNDSGDNYIPDEQIVFTDDLPDATKDMKADNELPSLGCEDDGPVFCGLCGDQFPNRNDLHAHFKTHEEF